AMSDRTASRSRSSWSPYPPPHGESRQSLSPAAALRYGNFDGSSCSPSVPLLSNTAPGVPSLPPKSPGGAHTDPSPSSEQPASSRNSISRTLPSPPRHLPAPARSSSSSYCVTRSGKCDSMSSIGLLRVFAYSVSTASSPSLPYRPP